MARILAYRHDVPFRKYAQVVWDGSELSATSEGFLMLAQPTVVYIQRVFLFPIAAIVSNAKHGKLKPPLQRISSIHFMLHLLKLRQPFKASVQW